MRENLRADEIEYFLGGCLLGFQLVDRGVKFERLLTEVLTEIWDDIEPETHRIGAIIFSDTARAVEFGWPHVPNIKSGGICIAKMWIIFFPDILYDQPEAEIKQTIAHEFAHFILGHKQGGPLIEKAADSLAAKWGFPRIKEGAEEK